MSTATEAARPKATVRISSPASVLAAIPPLLGFEPHASMVVIGTAPPRSADKVTIRYDLPGPGDTALAARLAQHSPSPPTRASAPVGWTRTFTDPRLCAAIVDRLTFNATIIETGTESYRLARARASAGPSAA